MKETMDEARKKIQQLAYRVLPAHPHHLSLSIDRKFPKPDGFWFDGPSFLLQYSTYISDADRGILLTRGACSICEEPEAPPPTMATKLLAKGDVVKKKLSIKDYQKKKNASTSPPDSGPPPPKMDAKPEVRVNGIASHTKTAREEEKREASVPQAKSTARHEPPRTEKARTEVNGERPSGSLPKPPSELENRKRSGDTDIVPPAQKRIKSESITARPDPSRSTKPDPSRARERPAEVPTQKSTKGETLHPTANGLAASGDRDRENTASPRSTIQVNGSRPRSDSDRSTPRRSEAPTKPSVPKLLSPLHPSLLAEVKGMEADRRKPAGKAPPKPSNRIPRLLSPTLPPLVEAELERLKSVSRKADGLSMPRPQESPSVKKTTKASAPTPEDENGPGRPRKPELIITLRMKKATAQLAKRLLSLPSKSAKERLRKERSTSVDDTPPTSRKRPMVPEDASSDGPAPRRSKLAVGDSVVARPLPSTPLKPSATSMSRVASNHSQGTPGNPLVNTPGVIERPPTRSDSVEPARAKSHADMVRDKAAMEVLREKEAEHKRLGSNLKHQRDDIVRSSNVTPTDEQRATLLHFEMILAYIMAFSSHTALRILMGRPPELIVWDQLMPHLDELVRRPTVVRDPPLHALSLQMYAITLEQVTAAYAKLDKVQAEEWFVKWRRLEQKRRTMWVDAAAACAAVEDHRMKTMLGPWTKVDDAVAAILAVLKLWAERHKVPWRPSVMKDKERERDAPPRDREAPRARERDAPLPRDPDRERGGPRDRDGPPRGRERDYREVPRDRDRDRDHRDAPRGREGPKGPRA